MERLPGPSRRQMAAANLSDVVAELQSSGGIFFYQSLTMPQPGMSSTEMSLELPRRFVQDYGHRIEKYVILRARTSSCGETSGMPRAVQVRAIVRNFQVAQVQFGKGWREFVLGNCLEEGDAMIFHLKEGGRTEFEVCIFRGPGGPPYYPDAGDSSSQICFDDDNKEEEEGRGGGGGEEEGGGPISGSEEEEAAWPVDSDSRFNNISNQPGSPVQSRVHHHVRHRELPASFRRKLTAYNFFRRDHPSNSRSYSGQFSFPISFVRAYGLHLRRNVKIQGVHEDSPVYRMDCVKFPKDCDESEMLRLYST